MTQPTSFIQLKDTTTPLAKQAFAIYEASFPVSDRDPVEKLVPLIQQSANTPLDNESFFRFWLSVAQEQVLGLSIYTYYHQHRLGYLWYLATATNYRNQRIGRWMFAGTLEKIRQEALEPPVGVCWEVERPSDAPDPHTRQLSEQRIRFYEKNGSILIPNVDLLTPASSEGFPDVTYHLMYYPLQDEPTISSARIRALVDFILLTGYGVSPTSIYYQQAMRSIRSIPQPNN